MRAEAFTERDVIRGVPKRWRAQYPENKGDKHAIWVALKRLDLETCTAADVDAVIGNGSWTRIDCDGCGNKVDTAVTVGQEPDYDSSTATICAVCLQQAVEALAKALA